MMKTTNNKRKGGKIAGIIVTGVLVIAVIALSGFFLAQHALL